MTVAGSSSRPLAPAAWIAVPALLAVAATIALGIPFRLFGLALPEPVFPLALAFAWAVIRPSVLGPVALLLLGLFLDLYWGSPRGLWAVSLLTAYGALLAARSLLVGQAVATLALWYAGAGLLAFSVASLITVLQSRVVPNLPAVGLQLAVSLVLFPLAYRLVRRFEDADVRFR